MFPTYVISVEMACVKKTMICEAQNTHTFWKDRCSHEKCLSMCMSAHLILHPFLCSVPFSQVCQRSSRFTFRTSNQILLINFTGKLNEIFYFSYSMTEFLGILTKQNIYMLAFLTYLWCEASPQKCSKVLGHNLELTQSRFFLFCITFI